LREGKKVIGAQSRQDEKVSGSHTESTTISLQLCAFAREKNKKIRRSLPTVGRRNSKATNSAAADSQEFQKQ